jgi:3-oxoacyl-[acyl-carrier protein] reductase
MNERQRVVLVSGSGRGIGAATARELGRRGYHVIVNYHRRPEPAAGVVRAIESEGGSAHSVRADVRDADQVAVLMDGIRKDHGRLDALVCNANTADPPFKPLSAMAWTEFAGKVDDELAGVFFLTQHAMEIMRAQGGGRIVYVSSVSAEDIGGCIAHATAKAALNTFIRHVAAQAGRHGITVNGVAPAAVDTDATMNVINDGIRRYLEERSVSGHVLEPEELGRVIATVADDGFAAMTGQIIRVDGGLGVLSQPIARARKEG